MASIEKALPFVFKHEGRFSNDPVDPGGATNWGISLRFLKTVGDLDHDGWPDGDINQDGKVTAEDIQLLSINDATRIYSHFFWQPNSYSKITDQTIATKIFDLAVNMGSKTANKCLQRAVRAVNGKVLNDDGIIGPKTLDAVNDCDPAILLSALKSEAAFVYRQIIAKNSKMNKYKNGWANRAYDTPLIQ